MTIRFCVSSSIMSRYKYKTIYINSNPIYLIKQIRPFNINSNMLISCLIRVEFAEYVKNCQP